MVRSKNMHVFTPFYSPYMLEFMSIFIPFLLLAALWTVVLKGFSLWYAARGSQKWWFIAILVINTLGILEIVYLIWFRPKKDSPETHGETPMHTSSSAPAQ